MKFIFFKKCSSKILSNGPKVSQAIKKLYKQTLELLNPRQLCKLFLPKQSSLPKDNNPGVSKVDCDCDGIYIGGTGADVRIDQHQKSVGKIAKKHAKKRHQQIE